MKTSCKCYVSDRLGVFMPAIEAMVLVVLANVRIVLGTEEKGFGDCNEKQLDCALRREQAEEGWGFRGDRKVSEWSKF
jgi:hypothetical protein